MTKSGTVKILTTMAAALIFAYVPEPASARRDGGTHGGGSHAGSSRGGGGLGGRSPGSGHFSFKGSGRSYGGSYRAGRASGGSSHGGGPSRGGGGISSQGERRSYGGGYLSGGRMGNGSPRSGGFFSLQSGHSARNPNLGGGRSGSFGAEAFGSSAASRTISRSGSWPSVGRNPAGNARFSFGNSAGGAGGRYTFGNSGGRAMPASTRSWGNAMGSGWHSFGGVNRSGALQTARGYGSNSRARSPNPRRGRRS